MLPSPSIQLNPMTTYPKCDRCPSDDRIRTGEPIKCYLHKRTLNLCSHHWAIHRREHLDEIADEPRGGL